ncbi:ribbon-helix-helix domain-containing protein [Asticcacaulis taihuensis]|uniref:Ribbon-helix-helix protein, copG family n=1 Tax=Asticcacaulis taihuensis TaxID=260084 RepID=A0A1G4SPT1_9CAUL|nr:CopG family transcriptional regulator [Asticcacaulis taihuensis]SCW71163.1 hypothetical protein SAMN02927928_2808 [Asticcacaulis taihuensis]
MKPKHHLYLDQDLSDELERLAAAPGTTKSAIACEALRKFFKHKGSGEHDAAIRMRLDRLSRAHERLARDVEVILESLTVYVKYDFMLTAHLPEPDKVSAAKGRERFDRFTHTVGNSLAQAHRQNEPAQLANEEDVYRPGDQK